MTAQTKKTTKNNTKKVNAKVEVTRQQKIIKIGGVIAAVIILLMWLVNSSFWPWPSSSEINRRLNEVIEACMYNERSRGCSSMQEKYHISFEYCHSLADIPEIGKSIPIYGVAKKDDAKTREISYRGGDKSLNKNPYYGCSEYLENMDKNISNELLSSEPTTMALFALYKTPQHNISGDSHECSVVGSDFNFLWDQIPNIEVIKSEYKTAVNTYNKCNQRSELQSELNKINSKLTSYAKDKTVQLFYKNYDDWTSLDEGSPLSCDFMGRSFHSDICITVAGVNYNNLSSFSDDMRSYTSTDDFVSKIVIEQ